MKTLGEIIKQAKSGEMPTHEECYWAMLALEELDLCSSQDLRRLQKSTPFFTPRRVNEDNLKRMIDALKREPKEWLENFGSFSDDVKERRQRNLQMDY